MAITTSQSLLYTLNYGHSIAPYQRYNGNRSTRSSQSEPCRCPYQNPQLNYTHVARWQIAGIKVQVETDQLPNQVHVPLVAQAISHVENRVLCIGKVLSGSINRNTDRRHPPFHHGDQVVQECEIRVCCVGHGLVALYTCPLSCDKIFQHPEGAPLVCARTKHFTITADLLPGGRQQMDILIINWPRFLDDSQDL